MKRLSILFFTAVLLLTESSCNKSLDKNPTDQLSSGTFWKSQADFAMALTACYGALQDYQISSGIQDFDGLSDNATAIFSYGNEQTIVQLITVSSHATDFWYYNGYKRIAQYNIFLKNLADYKGIDISDADRIKYEAEVRLLRGWEYYRLFTLFGSVPLVTEPLTVETQMKPKATEDEIFNQVISDCEFGIANLPEQTYAGNGGHFVKAAAQVLEARAYLYVAYDKTGSVVQAPMEKVVELSASVINSSLFTLGKSYRGLFAYSIGEQVGNPEYIYSVNYLAPNNSKQGMWDFNISTMQFYWNSVHALPSLLDTYEFSDGTPYNPGDPRVNPDYLYENRDPRMAKTVLKDSVHWENGTVQAVGTGNAVGTPYFYWKVCDIDEVLQNGGTMGQKQYTLNNGKVPLMRYAEVLLNHAEAVNETTGPTSDVYNDINLIRDRAGMPPLTPGLSKDQMREKIRYERRVELAFEGFRYLDIKRWRIAQQVMDGVFDGQLTRHFEEKNYQWPLPEAEIQINPALKQNPAY